MGTRTSAQIRSHAQKYQNKVFYEETHARLQQLAEPDRVYFTVHKSKKRLMKLKQKEIENEKNRNKPLENCLENLPEEKSKILSNTLSTINKTSEPEQS